MSIIGAFMVPHPPMIIPSVGRGSESQIEKTINSYKEVAKKIAELKPDTIIISSPHTTVFADYFHISPGSSATGSFREFGAPETTFTEEYDEELVNLISSLAEELNIPAGTEGERNPSLDHGTMVPLYFIEQEYKNFKLVRIGISGLPLADHYKLGMVIKESVNELDRKVVYVASGDLSHKLQKTGPYGFIEEGPIYDEKIMSTCSSANFGELLEYPDLLLERAAECGHPSFTMMAGALDGIAVETTALSHEDVTGVGYGLCYYIPTGEDPERHFLDKYLTNIKNKINNEKHDAYVTLARQTIDEFIRTGERLEVPTDLPKEMLGNQAGVFVSIHKFDKLRGCIGTFLPVTNCIAEEIISNAISASVHDNRFSPITEDELDYLEINVDVLSTPEDISSPEELDVKKYGVIVSSGYKRGLLLPDLDGIDTVEQQISIASRKGGIEPDDPIKLQRFEVIRHK